MVTRPVELRPPVLCSGRTRDFSGVVRVTSAKSATLAPRRPGVVGLYLRIPMSQLSPSGAEHVDALARAHRHDGPLGAPAGAVAGPGPLALARPVERVDVGDLDVEHLLDGDFD